MASNKNNKKKGKQARQLHPKNRARAAAAAGKTEDPPPSEETAAEPVSDDETVVDDDIGSGTPQEEYRLFEVSTTTLQLHEFAWHLNGPDGSRLLTPDEVREVVSNDRRRWRWEAYESSDNWYANHPYLVRYVSEYGMVMGGLYMFNDKARAVLCRDMLNSLCVMPESGAHTPDPKEEKTLALIEAPARHFLPSFAVEP